MNSTVSAVLSSHGTRAAFFAGIAATLLGIAATVTCAALTVAFPFSLLPMIATGAGLVVIMFALWLAKNKNKSKDAETPVVQSAAPIREELIEEMEEDESDDDENENAGIPELHLIVANDSNAFPFNQTNENVEILHPVQIQQNENGGIPFEQNNEEPPPQLVEENANNALPPNQAEVGENVEIIPQVRLADNGEPVREEQIERDGNENVGILRPMQNDEAHLPLPLIVGNNNVLIPEQIEEIRNNEILPEIGENVEEYSAGIVESDSPTAPGPTGELVSNEILSSVQTKENKNEKIPPVIKKINDEERMRIQKNLAKEMESIINALWNAMGELMAIEGPMSNKLNKLKKSYCPADLINTLMWQDANCYNVTIPMYVSIYCGHKTQVKMLEMLGKLPEDDLIEILKQKNSNGYNLAMVIMYENQDSSVRSAMLYMVKHLRGDGRKEILMQKNNDDCNLAKIIGKVHLGNDEQKAIAEIYRESDLDPEM